MNDQEAVLCRNWKPEEKEAEKSEVKSEEKSDASSGKRCEQKAAVFLRLAHSGRLAPLCNACKNNFISAVKSVQESQLKTEPKEIKNFDFTEVALEAGAEEYKKQPPKNPST